jgi:uncharacterized protein
MSYSMSSSVPAFEIALSALSAILDKAAAYAEARKIDPAVLLQSRLYPDMFPLVRQVQAAADAAKYGVGRLAGVEIPKYEDNESTIGELKDRVTKTIAFLRSVDPKKIDGSGDREITFPLGPARQGHMIGADYLGLFVLPNFYFHVTAAYAILRHNGLDIGKQDYLSGIPLKIS